MSFVLLQEYITIHSYLNVEFHITNLPHMLTFTFTCSALKYSLLMYSPQAYESKERSQPCVKFILELHSLLL